LDGGEKATVFPKVIINMFLSLQLQFGTTCLIYYISRRKGNKKMTSCSQCVTGKSNPMSMSKHLIDLWWVL